LTDFAQFARQFPASEINPDAIFAQARVLPQSAERFNNEQLFQKAINAYTSILN
jgi:hypothetical protein